MIVDFFNADCVTVTKEKRFGICDDEDKTPAYMHLDESSNKWIATVKNDHAKEITFTAIDNCIDIYRENGDMESRCDVMLTYESSIVFIELKNKLADWMPGGIAQLEETIKVFRENNQVYYDEMKKKRAFVANRKHTGFQEIENELILSFYRKYKVKLDCQATVVI